MSERTLRGAVAALAVGLTVVGQFFLFARAGRPGGGAVLLAAGIVLFLWAVRGRIPAARRLAEGPGALVPWLLAASALLSVAAAAGSVALRKAGARDYSFVAPLWLGAILAFVSAATIGRDLLEDVWSRIKARRRELFAVAALTFLGAALRFYRLGEIPAVIDGDEGLIGLAALQLHTSPLANPFASVDNVGGWYLRALSATIDVLGRNALALRFLSALGGALAVPAVCLLARRLFGVRVALYAGLLLAFSHAHIHFSRISSVLYLQGTFFAPLELYLLFSGIQNRSWRRLGLGGLVLGIHLCVYLDALMMAGAILVVLLGAGIFCRPFVKPALSSLPAFLLGAAVASLPGIAWAATNPQDFLTRFAVDGTFQSGWLEHTAANTGRSTAAILAGRFAHAFLTLVYYPATDFYGSPSPLLLPVTASFFLLGLALLTARPREPRHLLVAAVFWSLTAMIGLFAIPPSADSYRMVVTLPVVMISAAVGIDALFRALGLNRIGRERALAGVAALLFLPAAAWNVHNYFGRFAGRCLFWGDPTTRISSHLGRHLRGLPPDAAVYLLSDDHIRQGISPSLDFLSGGRAMTNWTEPAAALPWDRDIVLVAAPSRVEELESWARRNPGGSFERKYECEKLLFATYRPPVI